MAKKKQENLSAELDILRGQLLHAWSAAELSLVFVAMPLMQTTDEFRIRLVLSSFPNVRARHTMLSRLGENYLQESLLPKFNNLMKRFGDLSNKRNVFVHSTILLDDPSSKHMLIVRDHFSTSEEFVCDITKVPLNELKSHITATHVLSRELNGFSREMAGRVYTWPKMRRASHPDPNHGIDLRHRGRVPETP